MELRERKCRHFLTLIFLGLWSSFSREARKLQDVSHLKPREEAWLRAQGSDWEVKKVLPAPDLLCEVSINIPVLPRVN